MAGSPRVGAAYRITDTTVLRAGGGRFYVPSTTRFPDGPTGNPANQRVNNIATSVDNNRTFFTDPWNAPFRPASAPVLPGTRPQLPAGAARRLRNQFYRDEDGYPGRTLQFNVALQHQFTNTFSAEVAYTGLRGTHLPNTLDIVNQLGREFINRAANDPTVCSLTGNMVIPQGQPGYTSSQRDTCYGAFLRQTVRILSRGRCARAHYRRPRCSGRSFSSSLPPYTSANRPGYFGKSSYNALQLRADKRFSTGRLHERELHVLQELRQRGNGDRLAGGNSAGCRIPDQQSVKRKRTEQLRCPAPGHHQLRGRPAVRRRQAVRKRGDRASGGS